MAKGELDTMPENVELAILGEGELEITPENADAQSKEIVYRILGAESEDEIFEQAGTTSARDLIGVPHTIKNVRWQSSRYSEGGPKVFALVTGNKLDDGSEILYSCGGRNVLAQLYQLAKLGKMPNDTPLMLTENETASGFGALWLTKA